MFWVLLSYGEINIRTQICMEFVNQETQHKIMIINFFPFDTEIKNRMMHYIHVIMIKNTTCVI